MVRTLMTMGVVLALAAPAAAQRGARNDRRGPEVTENFSRTVRLGRNGTLDLTNIAGDIIVAGGGGDDLRIDAVKRARDRGDGRTRLQEVDIEVRELPNRVEVRTDYERNGGGGRRDAFVAVDFRIALPQTANVTLKTVSGEVRLTNVRGELNAESVSGDITSTGARRLTALKSVSGDIDISDAEAEAPVTISTVSGNLVAQSLKARGLRLTTVSGDVRLDAVEAERVELRSVNGTIQYSGPLARNGIYEMSTHSGDILLSVSTNGFDLEASTFSGDVRSDYALTLGGTQVRSAGDRPRGRRGGPGNRGIRGTFGDAGARLSLRSFSGNIVINRR